ncbi:MAG TPA: collagen binding domain-containing protein [Tissierellaceae bacterium]|nr:collagen binding domain-containing protein [Tissierellaceae bacterium]
MQHGSTTLEEGVDKDYTYNEETGLLTYIIPEGRDGSDYKDIKITTTVRSGVYSKSEETFISNQAYLKGDSGEVDISSDPVTHVIHPSWLSKTGSKINGNQIQWTIRANSSQQSMYDAIITDKFNSDIELDTTSVRVDGKPITVYDSTDTISDSEEIYGVYTKTDGKKELKIYLESGEEKASTSERVVTLVTDVVPVSDPGEDAVYKNKASLTCKYDTGGDGLGEEVNIVDITTEGVAVPKVFVEKGYKEATADDKRDGTITWTIKAVSNYSGYKKAQIVDTLPDLYYLPDKAQSYIDVQWLAPSGEFITLDEKSEPKAVISDEGKKLTISFEKTDNALSKEQIFHVRTKISLDAYGKNLDHDFRNDVEAILLDASSDVIDSHKNYSYIRVKNPLITKTSEKYTGNHTGYGVNPRVDFKITINGNFMNLKDVKVTDELNNLTTQFKKAGEDTPITLEGIQWTYLEDSIKINRVSGERDSLVLDQIATEANNAYSREENILHIDFGKGKDVNDSYSIEFTAELDLSKIKEDENYNIFKENGTIICQGNIANIEGLGVSGKISTEPTKASAEIKNEVLAKSGVYKEEEGQIMWTLKFNQRRIELDNTSVEDILPDGLSLDPTSIKLYKDVIGEDGNFISGEEAQKSATEVPFNYSYEISQEEETKGRNVLRVDLPKNEVDYILRFATDVETRLVGSQVVNSASYMGETGINPDIRSASIIVQGHGAGSSVTKTSIEVGKYSKDKKDSPHSIDGAIFELNWLEDGQADKPVFVRRLGTTDGRVTFYGLTIGKKYTITEVQSPGLYVKPAKDCQAII